MGAAPQPAAMFSGFADGRHVHGERAIPDIRIAASDCDTVFLAGFAHAFEDFGADFAGPISRQAQREKYGDRFCCHRGQVAQIDGDQFMTDSSRSAFRQNEVGTIAERIGRDHRVGVMGFQQSAIVTDPEFDLGQSGGSLFGPSDKAVFHKRGSVGEGGCGRGAESKSAFELWIQWAME